MDVIFHIDDRAKWPALLNNVQHFCDLIQARSDDATVEILVNGTEIEETMTATDVDLSLLTRTVNIAVCANSLHQRHYTQAQLQDGLTTVPSGVIELALRQHHGFAYIKP